MVLCRISEEKADEWARNRKFYGPRTSSVGQEAVPVGVCANLREDDFVTCTHRGGAVNIAKGDDEHLKAIWAEYLGKETGCCMGRAGSLHLGDFSKGILYGNAIVGGGFPSAVGLGLSFRLRGTDKVCAAFFGDGATNQGTFHESLNLASIWELPVVFVCENNQYGFSMPLEQSMKVKSISERGSAYAITSVTVDGNDVVAVYEASRQAVTRARQGKGPTLMECITYSMTGHYIGDPMNYIPPEELEQWAKRDPIQRFEEYLLKSGALKEQKLKEIREKCAGRVEDAMSFAEQSPDAKPEDALKYVFVSDQV